MVADSASGYKEVEHTADISLKVWSTTIEELFVQAVEGFNSIVEINPNNENSGVMEDFSFQEYDLESMLVALLSECNYKIQQDLIFVVVKEISIANGILVGKFFKRKLESFKKEIKAVTYHNLKIQKSSQGYSVTIVFDV